MNLKYPLLAYVKSLPPLLPLHEKLLITFTKSHPTGALKFHLKILSIQRLINLLCYASVNFT